MNIKPWQIFIFTLVPLAIAFAGVIGGSYRGAGTQAEHFIQPAAAAPPSGTPSAAPPAGATVLDITAKNTAFSTRSLRAAANAPITIRLNNQDAGLQHNITVYKKKGDSQPAAPAAKAELVTGPGTSQMTFTVPAATYYFQCDVHPDQMNGSLIVQ